MSEAGWYRVEGAVDVRLPSGWEAELDVEEGGVEIARADGAGVLHLLVFPQLADELPDPAEELFAFLDEQGIELEEDEVEDFELDGDAELALCEYLTEDEEEGGGAAFWLIGVGSLPNALVFGSYTCDAGDEELERETIRSILRSLRSAPAAS